MQTPATARTLTFLFTDIEGSTRLWERDPAAMRASLVRHDAILRDTVERSAGTVVKTTGDGLMAVFGSVRDGVDACLRAQLALLAEEWGASGPLRVRMGLHAGETVESDGDYHGPAVNRAARIMAAGHGGQVLLSGAVAALVLDDLPDGSTLLDLGEHRLKDLGRPERVFQLRHPGLPASFPPLTTTRDRPRELPAEPSTLVGREEELEQIEGHLRREDVRLLTLLGPGGIGKTRLALRAAADVGDLFEDGASFVDLEPVRDPGMVAVAVARGIGLPDAGDRSTMDELVAGLREQRRLLVLDNFEQVTPAAPSVARLVHDCPGLKVLVTSREALHVRGEHLYPVPPLGIPRTDGGSRSAGGALSYAAIRLFVERASAVRPDFRLTDENAHVVAEICRRLDGLPLAIELATARLRMLSVESILERLGSRLGLLRSGARDLPERQQTLRATIDWSYQLLEPAEQRLFELLSVFEGSSYEAVEAVAGSLAEHTADVDTLDGLGSLVDKSLVRQFGETDAGPRFVMLETIREYAAERLRERPDLDSAVRRAHAEHFAAFVGRQSAQLAGSGRSEGIARMGAEVGNLQVCWRYWVTQADRERLDRLLDGLWPLYDARGWYRAIIEMIDDLLGVLAASASSPERASAEVLLRMSQARALMAMQGYTSEVEEAYSSALRLIEREGSRPQLLPVLRGLASFHTYRAEFEKAAQLGREMLALAESEGDPSIRVDGLLTVGSCLGFLGDLRGGLEHLEEAIAWFGSNQYRSSRLRLGSDPRVACLATSAMQHWLLGQLDRSLERAEGAVALAGALEHPSTRAYALFHSGFLHHWRREPDLARSRAVSVIDVADEHQLPIWGAVGTCLLGAALSGLGQVDEGLREVRRGIDLYRGLRTPPVFWPLLLFVRATASAAAGEMVEGLEDIDAAIGMSDGAPGNPLLPELRLGKGDILVAAGRPREAETMYRQALDGARSLGVPMSQLRAAIRLARLPGADADAGDRQEALRAILEGFTEGPGTPDLREARELLGSPG